MLMLQGKKVIIFDLDGTLIDSVGIWNQVDEALIDRIRSEDAPLAEQVQLQRDEALRRFSKAASPYLEYCAFLKEKYKAVQSPEEIHDLRYRIAQEFLENEIDYKPDADALIRWLTEKGYILTIATTTRRNNVNVYRTRNEKIRKKADLDTYFRLVYTREDAKEIKPNPEIYLRVMEELALRPKSVWCLRTPSLASRLQKTQGLNLWRSMIRIPMRNGNRSTLLRIIRSKATRNCCGN